MNSTPGTLYGVAALDDPPLAWAELRRAALGFAAFGLGAAATACLIVGVAATSMRLASVTLGPDLPSVTPISRESTVLAHSRVPGPPSALAFQPRATSIEPELPLPVTHAKPSLLVIGPLPTLPPKVTANLAALAPFVDLPDDAPVPVVVMPNSATPRAVEPPRVVNAPSEPPPSGAAREDIPMPPKRPPVAAAEAAGPAANGPVPASVQSNSTQARSAPHEARQRLAAVAYSSANQSQPDNRNLFQKLFGLGQPAGPALAYAAPENDRIPSMRPDAGLASLPDTGSGTAIYDIAAHTVYMPDGERLEAHSGLGSRFDDPRYVNEKNVGATPPHVYDLELRHELFHGVAALRLNPVGEGTMYGRDGILAHSYMLGPRGDSNGCVSFRDYPRFLHAFLSGRVSRLVVVAHLSSAPASPGSLVASRH